MDVIGVVGEFDPFHLGHLAHFALSQRALGRDAPIVCVMSGDFVQRGAPAAFSKHARAAAAAACGADLVFELPLPWCAASAERFAGGAVGLLDSLGAVTHLAFGSESGTVSPLAALAAAADDPAVMARVRAGMAGGAGFAAAREAVLLQAVGPEARLIERPNDLLGMEYLRALRRRGSGMIPLATLRSGPGHDSMADGALRSAGRLRAMLAAGEDISPFVPPPTRDMIRRQIEAGRGPVTMEKLEPAIVSRLRALSADDFRALPDATEGLGNRLYRAAMAEPDIGAILARAKTKRYPVSRLRRMLLCAALGIRADTFDIDHAVPPYARLLAATPRGRALLRDMRPRVPVVVKPAAVHRLPGPARTVFGLTAAARDLYVLGCDGPDARRGGSDWTEGPAIL